MKRSGNDRAEYSWNVLEGVPSFDKEYFWIDDDKTIHTVLVDKETGIAFTGTQGLNQKIPRLALAELLDEGFEP